MTAKGVQVREVKGKCIKGGCRATFSFETKQVLLLQRSIRKGTVRVSTPPACSSRNHCCIFLCLCIQCTRPLSHKKMNNCDSADLFGTALWLRSPGKQGRNFRPSTPASISPAKQLSGHLWSRLWRPETWGESWKAEPWAAALEIAQYLPANLTARRWAAQGFNFHFTARNKQDTPAPRLWFHGSAASLLPPIPPTVPAKLLVPAVWGARPEMGRKKNINTQTNNKERKVGNLCKIHSLLQFLI